MRKKTRYKIAISGFYGDDNVGDDLLQIALIKGIKRRLEYVHFIIFTSHEKINFNLFKKEGIDPGKFDFIYSGRWGLKDPCQQGFKSFEWILKTIRELRRCDMHLIGPGNLIKDNTNRFLGSFWILKGFLSYLLGRPFAFFAIGIADVNCSHTKFLLKKCVNKSRFITVRDMASLKKLQQMQVIDPPMKAYPDLSYTLIDTSKAEGYKKDGTIKKIGLNFANFSLKFFSREIIENYNKTVLGFLKVIAERKRYELVFFPFSRVSHFNDTVMYDRISRELKKYNQNVLHHHYENIDELKKGIAACDAFIGTRFHAVLFSVQEGVPTITLSYDWKGKNFFSEAGLGGYAIEINRMNLAKLLQAWEKLQRHYANYISELRNLNRQYYDLSSKHFDMIEKHF